MKKSPFKMWGVWVGVVIAMVIASFLPILQGNFPDSTVDDYSLYDVISIGVIPSGWGMTQLILGVLAAGAIGFFFGWGIHSIARGRK